MAWKLAEYLHDIPCKNNTIVLVKLLYYTDIEESLLISTVFGLPIAR